MIHRLAVAAVAGAVLGMSPGAAAAAVGDPIPVGPHEPFIGLVNGAPSNAVIAMACFGPTTPGERGHPMAGQWTEAELSSGVGGFTGNAREIDATLNYPSPVAGALPVVLAKFTSYFVRVPISTSLTFPCAGNGNVVFSPVSGGPQARPWNVRVSFVGQP